MGSCWCIATSASFFSEGEMLLSLWNLDSLHWNLQWTNPWILIYADVYKKKTHRQGPKIGATNNSYAQLCAAHIDMRSGMIGTRLLGLRRMPRATLKAITSSSVLNPWLGSAHSPRSVWYIKHLAFSVIYDIIIRVQCLYIYICLILFNYVYVFEFVHVCIYSVSVCVYINI